MNPRIPCTMNKLPIISFRTFLLTEMNKIELVGKLYKKSRAKNLVLVTLKKSRAKNLVLVTFVKSRACNGESEKSA